MLSEPTIVLPLVVLLLYITIQFYLKSPRFAARARGRRLPPGPRGSPIIGNLLNIPKVSPWLGYRDLGRKYGNILSLRVMGQTLVVVNDASIAFDLLEKRSAIYSSRFHSPMIHLAGWDWNLGFMPYGQRWRLHRRAFWQHFNPRAIPRYHLLQEKGARRLLLRLLKSPGDLDHHLHYVLGATIIQIAYGLKIAEADDKYISIFEEGTKSAEVIMTGASVLEFFPFLARVPMWLPGTGFLRRLARYREVMYMVRNVTWADAKHKIVEGTSQVSVASALMEERSHLSGDSAIPEEEIIKNVLGVAYGAGTDTQFSTLQAFFVAMALYPEVQKKAQSELDTMVGPSRVPELTDRDNLPYVNALLKETLRWHPPVAIGVPHLSTEDDEYDGYFIPKNTAVLVNIRSIMYDPQTYPQPDAFIPERFLKDGKLDPDASASPSDPDAFVFGHGRRVCPGRHYADSSLFIVIASVLHTFNITPVLDEHGRLPRPQPTTGLISFIEGCKCTILPRSPSAEVLVRSSQL